MHAAEARSMASMQSKPVKALGIQAKTHNSIFLFQHFPDFLSCVKGKKAAGRVEELYSLLEGFETVLTVLGLWVEDPSAALQSMKELALKR